MQKAKSGNINGGAVWISKLNILNLWYNLTLQSESTCCPDQLALTELSNRVPHTFFPRGFNIGWYEFTKTHNEKAIDNYNALTCANGRITFDGTPVLLMHFHTYDPSPFYKDFSQTILSRLTLAATMCNLKNLTSLLIPASTTPGNVKPMTSSSSKTSRLLYGSSITNTKPMSNLYDTSANHKKSYNPSRYYKRYKYSS